MSSTSKVEVVRIGEIGTHPNADKLGIVKIHDGYTVVVGLDSFKSGDLAAYVVPDSLVPTDIAEFSFLADPRHPSPYRVRVKKLRGIISQGLLVPARPGWQLGQDVAEELSVTRYEPPEHNHSGGVDHGEMVPPPPGDAPVYDLEPFLRYGSAFKPDEVVVITEKIHGTNSRYTWRGDRLHGGSRKTWKDLTKPSSWSKIADKYPGIQALCQQLPGAVLYGEIYGWVQDLRYGHSEGEVSFSAFDILHLDKGWLHFGEVSYFCGLFDVPVVPQLAVAPLPDRDTLMSQYATGPSTLTGAANIREGCVVRPVLERWDQSCGRVHMKLVSDAYLSR